MSSVPSVRSVLSSAILVLLTTISAPAAVWVAGADLDPSHSFSAEITIDDGAGQIEFVLTGPEAVWFSLGLGGTAMNGTYAIVTLPTPAVEERILGNHTPGSLLTPAITTESHVVNLDGTVTFTLSRAQDPGTGAYVFDMGEVEGGVPIPVIWGVGQGAAFQYHGGSNRGSDAIQFEGDATPVNDGIEVQSFGATKLVFRSRPGF